MKPLAIRQVRLLQFKNYTDTRFSFGDRFNLISGLNGSGKTNLADAIYYLAVGKSYFTSIDHRIAMHGSDFFRLEAQVERDHQAHEVIVKVKPGALKELEVDHIPRNKISDHTGFIPIVFSAPRDIDIVTGGSQVRRRYMDHLLCQLDREYLLALQTYQQLLLLRNASLKHQLEDLQRIVQTYDDHMHSVAVLIFEKRKWLMDKILPLWQSTYATLADQRETIGMSYVSDLHAYPYEVLRDRHWEQDKATGRTNAGVHKDDFDFAIGDVMAKEYGSQGQIKSLIFSLHLTKYAVLADVLGIQPILILDDIFDKLDEERLGRLIDMLSGERYGQIFITDTSPDRIKYGLQGESFTDIRLT